MIEDLESQLPSLSPDAIDRREAILRDAQRIARRRVIARRVRRGSVVAGVAALLVYFIAFDARPPGGPTAPVAPDVARVDPPNPTVIEPRKDSSPAIAAQQRFATFDFAIIQTDAAIAREKTLPPSATTVVVLNDDQLLDTLQASGINAGIATVGTHTQLLTGSTISAPR